LIRFSTFVACGDCAARKLDADDLRHIDALLAEHIVDPVGPEFMAPPPRPRQVAPSASGGKQTVIEPESAANP